MTTNLLRGTGESTDWLTPRDGEWPADMDGAVVIVGPDKRRPGGHWFDEQGLLLRVELTPDRDGRIRATARRVRTTTAVLRERLSVLFRRVQFMVVSPFGVSNLANTNVQWIDGRLFVGYDAGRQIEVDPESLDVITPVGRTDEWHIGAPGLIEPGISIAAHPAPDVEANRLYMVNYTPIPARRELHIARWDLDGPVRRWRIDTGIAFDSIHDIKASRNYLVFTDLPFVVEPAMFLGRPRTRPNQDHTNVWIVAKADLDNTPPNSAVRAVEVELPLPTGHLTVDEDDHDGRVRIVLEHIPLADLVLPLRAGTPTMSGGVVGADVDGVPVISVQPVCVGRYEIDAANGEVLDATTLSDERVWGPVLSTHDTSSAAARDHVRELWYAGAGFDPAMVSDEWVRLYRDAGRRCVVPPEELPTAPRPGTLSRIDLDRMEVAEVYEFADGCFPSPPTFVPRRNATHPGDGYVVCLVHGPAPKHVAVFDAHNIDAGPLCRMSAPTFNPNLLLHSAWVPPGEPGPRSRYRVSPWRDALAAIATFPGAIVGVLSRGRRMWIDNR